jgi:hypothetical protein
MSANRTIGRPIGPAPRRFGIAELSAWPPNPLGSLERAIQRGTPLTRELGP